MREEAAVIMGFFTFRVFLVGTIFFVLPRISRKGLMFGIYLGEEQAAGKVRRELLRSWDLGCGLAMLVALLVGWGIGLSSRWITGNLTGTAVLLLALMPVYLRTYRRARGLAAPAAARQADRAAAPLELDEARGGQWAGVALGICLMATLAMVTYATVAFRSMPDRIPTLANVFGYGEELTDKSLVPVILLPSYNLVLAPCFALMALLITRAKRSVRGGTGGRSIEAQAAFRSAASRLFSGAALFVCLFLGVASWEMIEVFQGRAEVLSPVLVGSAAGVTILFMALGMIRLMRLGQGGARLETGSADAPLTGGLADDTRWILGVAYVNSEDPAILVESRFGIGYTMNLGNRVALALLAVYLTALLGLTALTLAELRVFG